MKKAIFFIFLLTTAIGLSSCKKTIHGSGHYITQTRIMDPFSEIESSGDFHIILTEGVETPVELYGEDNILPEIETKVSGNKLSIYYRDHKVRIDNGTVTIKIQNPEFKYANLQGSGKIRSTNTIQTDNLKINLSGSGEIDLAVQNNLLSTNLSGSGKIILTGSSYATSHTISGSGKVASFALVSENVKSVISGSGNCEVYANQFLDATISGSGNIIYKGSPYITTHISGSGQVKPY